MDVGGETCPHPQERKPTIMARKKTYEEEVVGEAADIIMQTIHIAARRIADRYESMLMDEVVKRIRDKEAARDSVTAALGDILADKLDSLAR